MAILLYPDGRDAVIRPGNGRYFTAEEKRRLVPGGREIIFVSDDRAMLVAPHTMADGVAYNAAATRIAGKSASNVRYIFGPALWFSLAEFDAGADSVTVGECEVRRVKTETRLEDMRIRERIFTVPLPDIVAKEVEF